MLGVVTEDITNTVLVRVSFYNHLVLWNRLDTTIEAHKIRVAAR